MPRLPSAPAGFTFERAGICTAFRRRKETDVPARPSRLVLEFYPQPELQTAAEILRIDVRRFTELTAGDAHIRIVVIHVVQSVEGVHMQLELDFLGNGEVLVECAIQVKELRSADVRVIP